MPFFTLAQEPSKILDGICGTRGAILFRGPALWECRAPGVIGEVLTSNGPGADPTYQPGGGGVPSVYAPGSFVVPTENYKIIPRHIKLTGMQRGELQGTATLRLT